MSKRRLFSSDEIINALLRCGFELHGRAGKNHQTLKRLRPGEERHDVTIVPIGKTQVPKGTLNKILKLANLDYDDFLDCAKIKLKGRKRKK
jgi:predicted RNA binding protein YcfA (HicA-like mRNA interferase family)